MEMTKTFENIDGNMCLRSVDFNYQMIYKGWSNEETPKDDSIIMVSTNAILYAYDYNEQFDLPFFDFTESMHGDYRKINAIPYNTFFWDYCSDFRLNANKKRSDDFFKNNSALTNQTFFSAHLLKDSDHDGFFIAPYQFWSEKRVFFKEDLEDSLPYIPEGSIPSSLYNLEAQIFMDVNSCGDSVNVITKTIFDPFKSYYYLPLDKVSTTFINLYFDIVEIKRIEFEDEIRQKGHNKVLIQSLYEVKKEETKELTRTFFKEVERCTNEKATLKWNRFVKDKLGIDNIAVFGTYEKEK